MKLAVTSDLHLGITEEKTLEELAEKIAIEGPDLLVLAGDIGEGPPAFRRTLEIFANSAPLKAAVAGNHDVWAHGASSRDIWERILPGHARDLGYAWLDSENLRVGEVAVAGSVAWYDYSAGDPAYPCTPEEYRRIKGEMNADAWYIDWEWDDPGFAAETGRCLLQRLKALQKDPAVRTIAVVSHVPLLDEQVLRLPGDRRWGISNAYYGNLTLGEEVTRFPKVEVVISGHTHRGRSGIRMRPGLPPLYWEVVGSEYRRPRYSIVDIGGPQVPPRGR